MRALLLAVLVGLAMLPGEVRAEPRIPSPLAVAEDTARCVNDKLAPSLSRPVWVEDWATNYRVVVPLKGQPDANRDVQSPPPAEDRLAWLDLYRIDDARNVPADLNGISDFTITGGEWAYVGQTGGYFWLAVVTTSKRCVSGGLGLL